MDFGEIASAQKMSYGKIFFEVDHNNDTLEFVNPGFYDLLLGMVKLEEFPLGHQYESEQFLIIVFDMCPFESCILDI